MFRSCGGIAQIHVVGCRGGGGALRREGNQLPKFCSKGLWWPTLCFHHIPFKLQRKGPSNNLGLWLLLEQNWLKEFPLKKKAEVLYSVIPVFPWQEGTTLRKTAGKIQQC